MGWKCNKCGNTEFFTEVNSIETMVVQEKGTTKIEKIYDKPRNEGALNVWCNKCDSEDVSWIEVSDQDYSYLKNKKIKKK